MERDEVLSRCAPLMRRIDALIGELPHVLLAIDGDAAAGKSTLAARLQSVYNSNLIHMDHFFLRPEQRTKQRLEEPGGNVDYERFSQEVLQPLLARKTFSYRPFDCSIWDFTEKVSVGPRALTIVEGAYSLHPTLAEAYHIKLFMTVEEQEQKRRIAARNGEEMARRFLEEWIPKEKKYFLHFNIENQSDFIDRYGIMEERTDFTKKELR